MATIDDEPALLPFGEVESLAWRSGPMVWPPETVQRTGACGALGAKQTIYS